MDGSIGAAANALQLIVAEGSIFHPNSDISGTFFTVPSGTDNESLNSTVNNKVEGAFAANALNYVGLEFTRQVDDSTTSQAYLWNPTTNSEFTKVLPLAETMDYKIVINSSGFEANVLPLAIVHTNSSNNVSTIDDQRDILFRLGTAGNITPNPFHVYQWSEGREENFWSSSSSSVSPFEGGDKQLKTLKDWMDAVMSSVREVKGTPYWYSDNVGGSIIKARADIANTVVTGRGSISHSTTTPGLINWSDDVFLTVVGSRINYKIKANANGSDIVLANNQAAYINLVRDQLIVPNLIFTNGSTSVESVGSVLWTGDVEVGDYVRIAQETFTKYYQVATIINGFQITLEDAFEEADTGLFGIQSMYAWATYEVVSSPSTNRHVYVVDREYVPFSDDSYWFLLRQDNADLTPNVYARFLGESLELGETQDINNDLPDAVKSYIGMLSDSDIRPDYSTAVSNFQVTTIESVAAENLADGQYFTINSANDLDNYYVWFNKDGGGSDPAPVGLTAIEVTVSSGDSSITVSIATAAAIAAIAGGTDFSAAVPTTYNSTIVNVKEGPSTEAKNVDVDGSFEVSTLSQGFKDTKNSQQNYFTTENENLTARVSKLTSMMADKAQDKTIILAPLIDYTINNQNGSAQELTFVHASGSPELDIVMNSSSDSAYIDLLGTLSLETGQVAYFKVNRNAHVNYSLAGLTIATVSNVPLDENVFVFAMRLDGDSVYLWDGTEMVQGKNLTLGSISEILEENAYDEPLYVIAGISSNTNEIQGPVSANTIMSLPDDSRDSGNSQGYVVGRGVLEAKLNGQELIYNVDFQEVGVSESVSTTFEILIDLELDDILSLRIDTAGGYFGVGTTGGGEANIGSNVGSENEIYKGKVGTVLNFRTIKAGTNISITQEVDTVTINSTSAGSSTLIVVSKNSSTTLLDSEDVILTNASGGDITLTLPVASSVNGKTYAIKKTDSSINNVIINPSGSETIDGIATKQTNVQFESFTIVCDGSNWFII